MNKRTCMTTFHKKQINSNWLAEYYEKELRINPEWLVKNFHKKFFYDLKCEVSKHSIYRAKIRALIKINALMNYNLLKYEIMDVKWRRSFLKAQWRF